MLCTFLVTGDQINEFGDLPGMIALNRGALETVKIGPIIHHIPEMCKIGCKLLLFAHRKLHMCFPLVPKLLTLSDLERRCFAEFGRGVTMSTMSNWLKLDHYCLQQNVGIKIYFLQYTTYGKVTRDCC